MSVAFDKAERYVIVGLGSIGRRHLANLRQLRPHAEIAILRRSPKKPPFEDSLGFQIFSEIADAVKFSPRAAIIASPASFHLPDAAEFVTSGIPVLIEKPLTNSAVGLESFIQLTKRHGAMVSVAYNLRLDESFIKFKRLIDKRTAGRILAVRAEAGQYLPNWRSGTDYRQGVSARSDLGGGVLNELSHELDYLVHLFGRPNFVFCNGGHRSQLEIDVEDFADLILSYEHEPFSVSLGLDFLQPKPSRTCKVIGDRGVIEWNAVEGTVIFWPVDGKSDKHVFKRTNSDRNQMYVEEMNQYLGTLDGKRSQLADIESAAFIVYLISLAKRSMNEGILAV